MKKKYVKPELTKMGDLDEFCKGSQFSGSGRDFYSSTPTIDCNIPPPEGSLNHDSPLGDLTCNSKHNLLGSEVYFVGHEPGII